MINKIVPFALLVAASLPALAQTADAPAGRPDRGRMFSMLDTNGDGRVTWEESWTRLQAMFAAADANRDGALTPEEFRNMRPAGRTRREPPEGERAERMQRFAEARFRAADANRDGKVTLDEMRPVAEARFRAMDANGDGAVVMEEMPRGRRPG